MAGKEKSAIRKNIESYASHGVLVFSGSLMVLSITFNNIGLGKIIDAYSQQMIAEIEHKNECIAPVDYTLQIESLHQRLKDVELLAHQSSVKQ